MICPKCHQENLDSSSFCSRCGESLFQRAHRRPVARGIVGLALSVPGLIFSIITLIFALVGAGAGHMSSGRQTVGTLVTVYCAIYGAIGLGLGITALALGRSAKDICEQMSNHYTGRAMYTTAQVFGGISCAFCVISAVLLVLVWR